MEERLSLARERSLGYIEFLELLMEDEYNNRRDNSYKKRYTKAKLPSYKTIEDFDFAFQPSIDKKTINDCLTCSFVKERQNIVFIGNPGTGKKQLIFLFLAMEKSLAQAMEFYLTLRYVAVI
ncbi:MAG: ATP-binding protein [bacterium]|nr:ATP-binding protein [bacterium]